MSVKQDENQRHSTEMAPISLMQMIAGYRTSQCIRAVVEFGIPEMLEHGALRLDDIAERTGTRIDLIKRVLDHLVSVGIIERGSEEIYRATLLSRFLVLDKTAACTIGFVVS